MLSETGDLHAGYVKNGERWVLDKISQLTLSVPFLSELMMEFTHYGNSELIDAFISRGADVNHCAPSGMLPLEAAINASRITDAILVVRKLLERGANANATCSDGRTVLTLALCLDRPQIVHELLRAGAQPNWSSSLWDESAISYARRVGAKNRAITEFLSRID
ncbi:MAG: ankyrin repeat domain-containing protein [Casimicrobium sp.]